MDVDTGVIGLHDTDQNTSSTETLTDLNLRYANLLLPFTVSLGLFGLVGTFGNLLVILIYGFKKDFRDKKFRTYVITLAVIDLVTCVILIPAEMWKHRSYYNFVGIYQCKIKCFLNVFAASAVFYCLLLVAVDRYIITCHPLLPIQCRTFSHKMALRLCVVMVCLGAVTAVPAGVMCGISTGAMVNMYGNYTVVHVCQAEPGYEHSKQRALYRYTLVTLQAGFSFVLVCLYAQIGYAVVKVLKLRRISHRDYKVWMDVKEQALDNRTPRLVTKETVTTTMPSNVKLLFLVTFVFIVIHCLYNGLSFVDQTNLSPKQFLVFSIFFRLYLMHSILNPFIYVRMDRQFKKHCKQIFKHIFRIE